MISIKFFVLVQFIHPWRHFFRKFSAMAHDGLACEANVSLYIQGGNGDQEWLVTCEGPRSSKACCCQLCCVWMMICRWGYTWLPRGAQYSRFDPSSLGCCNGFGLGKSPVCNSKNHGASDCQHSFAGRFVFFFSHPMLEYVSLKMRIPKIISKFQKTLNQRFFFNLIQKSTKTKSQKVGFPLPWLKIHVSSAFEGETPGAPRSITPRYLTY